MERKRTGRLLATVAVALVATLGLVIGLGSTAYAKEYTTLSVGDVLHVGDSINSTTEYAYEGGRTLGPSFAPFILVRANIVNFDIVDNDKGDYYFLKAADGYHEGAIETYSGYEGSLWPVTSTSDGIYVTSVHGGGSFAQVTLEAHDGIAVTGVTLDPSAAQTITEGDKVALTATVTPDDASDKTVKWTVGGTDSSAVELYSDETCETPVETGKATETLTVYAKGVSTGKATVTCTSNADPDKSASCDVTVEAAPVPVASVELSPATATLEPGKTVALKATVKPDNADDKSVVWASSDEKVATVSEDGVVTAVAPGKATITATSVDNDEASAECALTVKAAPKPEPTPTDTKEMYRLYNPNSGEHFYTANAAERDNVKNAGWTYEGVGWTAPESGSPVYRLYNEFGGEHHYTTSKGEHDSLVALGWKDEGVGWYSGGSKPLYRQYNPNAFANNHNYTTSKNERDTLLGLGWRDEGIAWYGL